jgi:hypothetical protein
MGREVTPRWSARGFHIEQAAPRSGVIGINGFGPFLGANDANTATYDLALIVPRLQPVTAEILGRLHTLSQRYVQVHLSPKGRNKRATREHMALFESWAEGKAREVKGLIEAHIESTRKDLAAVLASSK